MRRYIPILLTLGLPAAAFAEDAPKIAPPPAWVQPVIAPKGPAEAPPADAPIVLLKIDQQLHFGADADERYFESAVKIQAPAGLGALGTITLPWNPDSSTLTVHKLHIVRGGETIDVLGGGKGFTVLRREAKLESAILDGMLTATIQPEGLQVGDIVELAFTLRYRDPSLRDHSEALIEVPPNLTGTLVHVSAAWPATLPISWRKTEAMPAPKSWKDKNGNHLEVTLQGTGPLVAPNGAPGRFAPARVIEFTGYRSWADESAAIAPLYVEASVIPPGSPLAAEVAKIKAASADPKQRAAAALKLVQEGVRYVYQGMNSGNLVPAKAADTWARRFGDCKGKTALLLAMLHALDITAEPATVSTTNGDGLDARLPMAALFDHILVRAEIGGAVYWLDGTRPGDGPLDTIAVPPFHWALPVRSSGASLIALVQAPLSAPDTVTNVALDASHGIGLPAPATVTVTLRGDDARGLNAQLSMLTGAALDEALKTYWKRRYAFITPTKTSARYDPATVEEVITMTGTAKLGWTAADYGYELDGAGLGFTPDYKREPGPAGDAPVTVTFPYYVSNIETIRLPQGGRGFTIDTKDVDSVIGGYHFVRKTSIKDGLLTMESSTRGLRPEIPYAEALASVDALTKLDKERVYVKAPDDYDTTPKEQAALVAVKPEDAKGYVARGNNFLDHGDYDKAIADFDQAITMDVDNAMAFADRGIARAWKGEDDKALDDFDKAAAIDPRLAQLFHGRSIVLTHRGEFGAAIAALSRAIDLQRDNVWALQRRAGLRLMQADYPGALADADAMLKIQPGTTGGLLLRQRIQAAAGKYAEALAILDGLAKTDPDLESVPMERGYVLAKMGKADEARAAYASLRAKGATNGEKLNNLCWSEAQASFDLPQALNDCDAALKLEPGQVAYLDSSGLVLLRMERYDEAIQRYDRALAKGSLAPSLYGRGIAKLRKGMKAAGDADIAAAIAKDATVAAEFAEFGVKP